MFPPSALVSCFPQVSKKYVSKELAKEIHAKAAPFVKWLKEAEEESEGSEEEEEEEDDENVEVRLSSFFLVWTKGSWKCPQCSKLAVDSFAVSFLK